MKPNAKSKSKSKIPAKPKIPAKKNLSPAARQTKKAPAPAVIAPKKAGRPAKVKPAAAKVKTPAAAAPASAPAPVAAAKPETSCTEAPQKPSSSGGVFKLALLILIVGGASVMWKLNHTPEDLFSFSSQTTTTSAATDTQLPPPPPPMEDNSAVMHQLDTLKTELAERETEIQTLEQQLQDKEQSLRQQMALREFGFLKHYASLIRSRVELGKGFAWELEQARGISTLASDETRSLLKALKTYEEGVDSRETLRDDLNKVGTNIVATWKSKSAGSGIEARLKRLFQQLVSIRKVGLVDGNTPEDIMARAEYYSGEHKLGKALDELSALNPPYSDLAQNWIERAENTRNAIALAIRLEHSLKGEMPSPNTPEAELQRPESTAPAAQAPANPLPPEAETIITLPPTLPQKP